MMSLTLKEERPIDSSVNNVRAVQIWWRECNVAEDAKDLSKWTELLLTWLEGTSAQSYHLLSATFTTFMCIAR